jgi:hypothetical protein
MRSLNWDSVIRRRSVPLILGNRSIGIALYRGDRFHNPYEENIMPYSQFSIDKVKQDFHLKIVEGICRGEAFERQSYRVILKICS